MGTIEQVSLQSLAATARRAGTSALPFDALVRRELLTTLRLRRTFMLLLLLVLASNALVISGVYNIGLLRDREFYLIVVLGFLFISCAVLTALASCAFTVERERNTIILLRTSLVTPGQWVWAKLSNAMGLFVVFAVAVCPMATFILTETGLAFEAQLLVAGIVLSTVFACSAAGVFASAANQSTAHAVTAGFMLALFTMGLHVLIVYFAISIAAALNNQDFFFSPYSWPTLFVPPIVIQHMVFGGRLASDAFITMGYLILLGLAFMAGAHWLIARETARESFSVQIAPRRGWFSRKQRRVRHDRYHEMPERLNPVFWIEWLSARRSARRSGFTLFAVFLVLFGTASLSVVSLSDVELGYSDAYGDSVWVWFNGVTFIISVLATIQCANLITRDHDRANLDFIRGTTLSPLQLVYGKVFAGLTGLAPVLAAMFAGSFAFWFVRESPIELILCNYLLIGMTVVITVLGASIASALCKNTSTAVVGAVAFNTFLLGGYIYVGALVAVLLTRGDPSNDFIETVAHFSPVMTQWILLADANSYYLIPYEETSAFEVMLPACLMQSVVVIGLLLGLLFAVRRTYGTEK